MSPRFGYLWAFAFGAAVASGAAVERQARAEPLLERFEPAERGSRFFVADSLELDGDLRFVAGVVSSYGNRLRTFGQQGDAERSTLVEHALWIHPGAALVMSPGVRLALDIPIALQAGEDVTLDRTVYSQPGSPRLGDVRASFDIRLAGRERADDDGVTVAAGTSAYLPTGSGTDYASDDFARFTLRLAISFQRGAIVGAARAGYMYRKDDLAPMGGVHLGSEANGVFAIGYRHGALVLGPELHGSTILKGAFERRSTPVEALAGAHLRVGQVQLGAGLGTALINGLGAPRVRGVLSIEWTPRVESARDRDHDGVMDPDDMCPDVAGLADGSPGARGCPAAPMDRDGDGVVDEFDACPDVPGIATHRPATHGCPATQGEPAPDAAPAAPQTPAPEVTD